MSKAKELLDLLEGTNDGVIRTFASGTGLKPGGTKNLKIEKKKNGWALINYETPIAFRNTKGTVFVNITKYSKTTTTIQNQLKAALAPGFTELDEKKLRAKIK